MQPSRRTQKPRKSCGFGARQRLRLEPLEDRLAPAVIQWDGGGGDFLWTNALNWSGNALPGPSDDVVVNVPGVITVEHSADVHEILSLDCQENLTLSGGALSIVGAATVTGSLTFAGGALEIQSGITVGGMTTWQSGGVSGAGSYVASGGLNFTTGAMKLIAGVTVALPTGGTWDGGDIAMDEGAVLQVPGGQTLNPQANNSITRSTGIGTATVQILGTFRKSTGSGATTINSAVGFSNGGLVEVLSGTLRLPGGGNHTGTFDIAPLAAVDFSGGNHVLGPTSVVTGGGEVIVSDGTTTVSGSFAPNTVTIESVGSLVINADVTLEFLNLVGGFLSGTGDIVVTGQTIWTVTRVSGAADLRFEGGLGLDTQSTPELRERAVYLNGMSVWTGTSFLVVEEGASIVIEAGAILECQSNAAMIRTSNTGSCFVQNFGLVRKQMGVGFTRFGPNLPFINDGFVDVLSGTFRTEAAATHSGGFTVGAGSQLEFNNAASTFTAASSVSGAGGVRFDNGSAIINGFFNVGGDVFMSSTVVFNVNVVISTLEIVSVGVGVFNGSLTAGSIDLNGSLTGTGVVNVTGLTTWTGGGEISGLANFHANGGLALNTQSIPLLRQRPLKIGGNSTWTGSGTLLMNQGSSIHIQSGVLFDAQSNATIARSGGGPVGSAIITVDGTFRKSVGVGTTTIAAGVTLTNNGLLDVQTGALSIFGVLTNFAGTTLTGGAFNVSGQLSIDAANIVTNAAVITLNGPASAILQSGGFTSGLANFAANAAGGSFSLQGGRNFTTIGAFSNAGNVTIGAGSIFATGAGSYTQTGGSTIVQGTLDPFASLQLQGGTLAGAGSILGPIIVSGTGMVLPGGSPGILNATGNFTMSAGASLAIELNGPTAGTQYDQVNVAGIVDVSGATLAVTRGFTPSPGQSFVVVNNDNADAVVGTFAGLAEGATINVAGVNFTISYAGGSSNNDIVLTAAAADATAPTVVGVYFDGSAWTTAFRAAAGNPVYGYPAQTGGNQLRSMPWSTINTVYVAFSEDVTIVNGNLGIRGVNFPGYSTSMVYDAVNFVAKFTLATPFDTDRILLDLDGNGVAAVADLAGNKLAGTWAEGVSGFPSTGAGGVDFLFRFAVAVGDVDRNGQVRNVDLNAVRNNLFIDIGNGGYNLLADIDGNGQLRNADLNATRNHLFVDVPPGPGPLRGRAGRIDAQPNSRSVVAHNRFISHESESPLNRRPPRRSGGVRADIAMLDALFAEA